MSWRVVASTLINLIGIVAPVAYYAAKFGLDSRVLTGGASTSIALLATVAWAFTCALLSAGLLRSERRRLIVNSSGTTSSE